MQKFSELEYRRPDFEQIKQDTFAFMENFRKAESYEEEKQLYLERAYADDVYKTMNAIARIRNTGNTKDEFYDREIKYFNSEIPKLSVIQKESGKLILESKWRDRWEEDFGELFIQRREAMQKLESSSAAADTIEEKNLQLEYARITAGASIAFRGKELNFYGLLKEMESLDRNTRKEAMMAWGDLYESISGKLDDVYDRMIVVRSRKAKNLGFDSYIDYIYLSRNRFDYNAADIAGFRDKVKKIVVPVCEKLRKEQAKRLGLTELCYYDEFLNFSEGNAVPIGSSQDLIDKAQDMYRAMSPEAGAYFDHMKEHELFDLITRSGKQGGGYCCMLQKYRTPFLFSNFNGTSADVDVLVHEAGHGFEFYSAMQNLPLTEMNVANSEVAEIHSMSMELFAHPYMKSFFGDKAGDYCKAHLWDTVLTIPYLVAVDEFQHDVFMNPEMGAAGRKALWHSLEEKYLPWRNYDGHRFLEEGGFWMQKQHIFMHPFYYIEYALAQTCAYQFYIKARTDRKASWDDYYRLCCIGGKYGYYETLKYAGLKNPITTDVLAEVMQELEIELFE